MIQTVLIAFSIGLVASALPGVFILAWSYYKFPPLWWRKWRSKRIKGSYHWRVYE
jgi:hypothetical protein